MKIQIFLLMVVVAVGMASCATRLDSKLGSKVVAEKVGAYLEGLPDSEIFGFQIESGKGWTASFTDGNRWDKASHFVGKRVRLKLREKKAGSRLLITCKKDHVFFWPERRVDVEREWKAMLEPVIR
jgi:hypothetical protein